MEDCGARGVRSSASARMEQLVTPSLETASALMVGQGPCESFVLVLHCISARH
jgi:hypothetical protein